MSDTSQVTQAPPTTNQVAFTADTAEATWGPGTEAPRAIQEQQARAAAAAASQQQQAHPQQALIDAETLKNQLRSEINSQFHTQIEEMRTSIGTLQQERDAAVAAATAEQERLAAEAKAAEEEKMGAKAFAEAKTAELQQQIEQMRQDNATAQALLAKEREFSQIQEYRAQRLAQEDAQEIIPQFRDLVQGNSPEEIEQSVQNLIARSQATVQDIMSQQAAMRQQAPGISTRSPGALSAPQELIGQQQPISKEYVDGLSMADYAKQRQALLGLKPQGF